MRKELLNQRPTSALRGQSPLCESVGTGHTSTHPSIFTKVLLVLLTTLLLPLGAWAVDYPITVAGVQVTDANAGNIIGDGITGSVTFASTGDNSGTLTLNNATIIQSIDNAAIILDETLYNLTIDIMGDNTIQTTTDVEVIRRNDETKTSIINFTSSTKTGSLILQRGGETPSSGLFSFNVNVSETNTLTPQFLAPENANAWTVATKAEIKALGLTVAGVTVTTGNNTDILDGDNTRKVSFTLAEGTNPATLTLNGATITRPVDENGILYSGTEALIIKLKGSNTISCSGEGIAILCNVATAPPILTIAKGDANPCSLVLEAGSDGKTTDGFEDVTISNDDYNNNNLYSYDIDEEVRITTYTTLGGGSGTSSDDPIIIKTADDLKAFSILVNNGSINANVFVKLSDDISDEGLECGDVVDFEPIGNADGLKFTGTFDGNNKTIKNLAMETVSGQDVGFFRSLSTNGTITNLTLDNLELSGGNDDSQYVGGLVGDMDGGTINNCIIKNSTVSCLENSQNPTVGGLVGTLSGGTISKCTILNTSVNAVTTDKWASGANANAGGLVGLANGGSISECLVGGTTTLLADYGNYSAGLKAGAIIASMSNVTLAKNKYEYTVTTSTNDYDGETETTHTTTHSGYTQRGIGGTYYNENTDENEPNPDVFTNDGAVMDTRMLALPAVSSSLTVTGDDEGYYAYATGTTYGILGAPGKPVKVKIDPKGNTITDVSVTYGTSQTATITKTKTEEGISFYTISEMPDADNATLNVTYNRAYDLWIGETQVTDDNKDHILGEGNKSVTFAVTGNEAAGYVNTLTLDNANFTGNIQWKNSEDLIVNLIGSNEITITNVNDYVFVGSATSGSPKLTLTTNESEPGTLKVNGLTEKTSIASGWSSFSSKFVYSSDDYPADGDWWVQAPVGSDYMDITLNRKYDLWISRTQYCDANLDPIAGAKFVPGSSTLEYSYTGEYSFTSSLPALKVKIKTASAAMASINFAATVAVPKGTLTFQADDSSCKLTLLESFAGFDENDVIYEDNLVFRTIVGVDTGSSYSVETISKPTMTGDGSNVTFNFNAGLELHYSIDYVKEGVDDVTDETITKSGSPVALSGPCTVTAYTKWNNSKSDNVVGTLFGFADTAPTATYQVGGTVNSPSIVPSLQEFAEVTYADSEDEQTNTINSGTGVISINGVATESYTATTVFSDGGYEDENENWVEVLNSGNNGIYNLGTFSLAVTPKSLSNDMIQAIEDQTYTGTALTPAIEVKDGETTLTQAEDAEAEGDFTVAFSNNTNAALSTAETAPTVTITGKGNYSGTATKTFTIAAKDASAATIILKENMTYTYNGSEQSPEVVSVELTGETIPDTNYDISYSNNKNAGLATAGENAPTVIVTFKNNYSGEATTTFTIEQADLSDYVVTGLTTPTAYTGSPITPTFSVKATETAETSLTANTDYSVKYQQAGADVDEMKDAGDYKILITGEGNYKGSLDADFTIERAQLNLTINLKGWAYGDTPNEPSLEGNLGEGDITWEYKAAGAEAYSAWSTLTTTTDAGTYMVKATVAETNNYEGGSKEDVFVIAQLDISDAVITLDKEELTYNGEQQTVNVTKVMAGDIEVAADYYEISGNSGTEAGNYTLTVTAKLKNSDGSDFKNNFTGSAEKTWKININHRTASAEELGFKSETQTASTYYNSDEDFNLPEGYVAYIITGINGNSVTTQRVSYIPNGVAVLVEKGQSSESPNDATPYPSTLPLKGTQEPVDVTSITGGTVYVLYNGEFVKSTSGTIPAHRCYLLIPDQIASGTRSFGIDHGDGTTSLREVKGEKWADGEWYTLQGRKFTTKPTKPGLYILNGKKVVIK